MTEQDGPLREEGYLRINSILEQLGTTVSIKPSQHSRQWYTLKPQLLWGGEHSSRL